MTAFVRTVLAETEDTWNGIFKSEGETYEEPTLVLFSGQVRFGLRFCLVGDRTLLLPGRPQGLSRHRVLYATEGSIWRVRRFCRGLCHRPRDRAPCAEPHRRPAEIQQLRRQMSEVRGPAKMSVRVELQADCYAGIWASYTDQKGLLEAGDLEEALNAAHQIGDDTLQKRSQGYVVPDSFNHGARPRSGEMVQARL